jgi:hypothetical protein
MNPADLPHRVRLSVLASGVPERLEDTHTAHRVAEALAPGVARPREVRRHAA